MVSTGGDQRGFIAHIGNVRANKSWAPRGHSLGYVLRTQSSNAQKETTIKYQFLIGNK
jgi:hypothetical protein